MISDRLERIEKLILLASKNVLTVAEVALMMGITEGRVRHLTSEKELPYYKQGKKTFFKKSEIESWMLSNRVPTNAEIKSIAATRCFLGNK